MSVGSAALRLAEVLAGEVRTDEPMARHTTYRIGGPADLLVTCDTVTDLAEAERILAEEGIESTVIGKGSNLLVADAGYRGAILVLGREFKAHAVAGARITCGAGCILAYVVRDAFSRGLSGMEFAVGIPGTVGGAIAMNAGTGGVWMDSVIESVTLHVPGEGLRRVAGTDIAWGYRTSGLASAGVIVESVVMLEQGEGARIRAEMERSLQRRKATQPLGMPCAGSVFKNPPDYSAGRLIEAAGLKGTRLGGARVSEVHANFIVNDGGARAADVLGLIRKIQIVVRDTHGIELEPEIRLLGSFDIA
ncbi:MAG: UDP-N-acetylmuramate dehydrogenase [Coriobacteriia bacterium]|nr:UDP-N-acetylmuramate dehydrogenase [Coriobacteriia bacterium]